MTVRNQDFLKETERLFRQYGEQDYGEHCTQYEHMAQCGWWAEQQGCSEDLIVAAFLHDIGHLLAENQQLPGRDRWGYAQHDTLAADWLRDLGLPETVCAPIAMHVEAKRYLVATQPDYAAGLSEASQATLAQQGGPMNEDECAAFAAHPSFDSAIRLRQLDELGKAEEFSLPPLETWLAKLADWAARQH